MTASSIDCAGPGPLSDIIELQPSLKPKAINESGEPLSVPRNDQDSSLAKFEVTRSQSAQSERLQSWNKPRRNTFRVAAAFFSFVVFGMNDAAYGALVPYLELYYGLSYTTVSLIFLSPFAGYTIAALLNATIHVHFGQRGIAILAVTCQITAYAVISAHPPYPAVVVMYAIAGFGCGLIDAAWSAWMGNLQNANAVQGFLHSCYSLGATISPTVATSMIVKRHWPWYSFYWFMTGCAGLSLIFLSLAFWDKSGAVYQRDNPADDPSSSDSNSRTKAALRNRITWICAIYFLTYVGAEVALGGWIVSFMLHVRHASSYSSGISSTGFWAGQTAGRAGLGLLTNRFATTNRRFRAIITLYLACAVALQLVMWLVPDFVVSAVAVALMGVFLGPLFPAGIVMAARLLPAHLHVGAIGFATALGGTGGAVFPFAVGAIAQAKGVQVLQPIILALLLVIAAFWLSFPRTPMKRRAP